MSTGVPYGDPDTRTRVLEATWGLISGNGPNLRLSDVAERAAVSRQAVYLHFGDRSGLLVALVHHMDETLDLGESLAHVQAAQTGAELIERTMRLNTEFWAAVQPVAQVLEAAQYDDEALGAAWRERMEFRQMTFTLIVQRLVEIGELSDQWSVADASALLYAVAHFDTWRELTLHLGFSADRYVAAMQRLCGSLLSD